MVNVGMGPRCLGVVVDDDVVVRVIALVDVVVVVDVAVVVGVVVGLVVVGLVVVGETVVVVVDEVRRGAEVGRGGGAGGNGAGATPARAETMNRDHTSAGQRPPVTATGVAGGTIGVAARGKPIQTAVANRGV